MKFKLDKYKKGNLNLGFPFALKQLYLRLISFYTRTVTTQFSVNQAIRDES